MNGTDKSALLARGFLSQMSETSAVSDELYRKVIDAELNLPSTGPEPSAELVLSLLKNVRAETLTELVYLVRSPDTLDKLVRSRTSKQLWRAVSDHDSVSLETAEYLARRCTRKSVSDKDTFAQLAGHPEISLELLIGYLAENPDLRSDWFARTLGANAAKRPDQWHVLLDGDMESLGLLEAQAALIGHLPERHRQVEVLERLPAATRGRVASLVFTDRNHMIMFLSFDAHAARLLERADEDVSLRGVLDRPIDAEALKVLSGSRSVVAHRLLLSSKTTSQEVKSEVLSRMEAFHAGDSDTDGMLPVPPLSCLYEAVLIGGFNADLRLRALRLAEQHDPEGWGQLLKAVCSTVSLNLSGSPEGRALVEYLAEKVVGRKAVVSAETPSLLSRFDHLPPRLAAGLLRLTDWETTASWFARAAERDDPERVAVLDALLAQQGRAFNNLAYSWAGPLTLEQIISMRVSHLMSKDEKIVERLMTSCNGVLSVGNLAGNPAVVDWLTGACAKAGVSPERGYDMLLSLMSDWEGTPRELVDTVAAVS